MGQARDEAGNIWETDAQGNAIRLLQPAGGAQPMTVGTPDPAAALGLPQAQADLANTQGTIADRASDNARADAALVAELYSKGMRLGANGQPEPIPGWVKPGEGAGALTAEMRGTAMNQYGTLANLAAGVNDLREQYAENFKGTNPLEGFGAAEVLGVPIGAPFREQDRIFNDRSGALTAFIATALGLSGQQFNTPAEQKLFIQSILPKAGDTDGQIESKLETLDELIVTARNKGRATLGYTDETDPLLADPNFQKFAVRTGGPPPLPSAMDRVRIGNTAPTQTAGFGATEGQTITIPPELNAASDALVARLMQEGGGRIDPDAYASEFAKIVAQYPEIGISPEASAQWARDMNAYLDAGGKTIPGGVQIQDRPLSGVEQFRNSIVDNPVGSTVAGVANAGGFGLPSLLAGEGYDALRESRPVSQMVGEIGGGITGTALAGKALGMGAGMVGRESIAELLANPMTADMAYGAAYGATQGEDPLTGLAIGAGGSLLGSTAGTALGKTLPRATGVGPAADTLLPGERMVFDATNRTGRDEVAEALAQAANLGVPAGLADVSPDVNSLTGAAMRRSPTAAGPAAETLMARGRGQYDRLLGAVERDLGPIENIPQRSEDLITQARAQAGPLYEAAYAAPGAESVDLADLAERPTFEAALREAYQEVLDEGLDPSAIGLQQAGDNIMVASPSWQALDYVKRGLDNIIERNTSKIDGVSPEARRAIQMKNMLLARMDEANPDYAAARAAYAGPAQERAALQSGQEALRMSPNQLGVNMGNASPSQAAQMRLGFQSGLAEQAGRVRSSTNPFESTLGTPAMEQRLAAMGYGPDEVARLLSQRDLERQVAGSTNRLIGNSATAERQLADQAFGAESSLMGNIAQGAVETAITGAPVATTLRSGMGRGLGQSLRDWRTLGVGERARTAADQIIPLALDIDPENAARQLLELASRDEAYQVIVQELLDRAGRRGAIGGAGTSAAVAAELAR